MMKLTETKEKIPVKKTIFITILLIGILLVGVSLGQNWIQVKAENYIKSLAKKSGRPIMTEEDTVSEDSVDQKEEPEEDEDEARATVIDFEALREENPDIVAWITVPSSRIDYPVLRATDEKGRDYYLDKNYKEEKDSHGSLYIETGDDCSFTDRVTIVYGHNMRDGSMLGTLYGMYHLPERYDNRIYIYTPDGKLREGKLLACYKTDDSMLRDKFNGLRDVQDIFDYIRTFDNTTDIFPMVESKIINRKYNLLTLSTCTSGGKERLLAQYVIPTGQK